MILIKTTRLYSIFLFLTIFSLHVEGQDRPQYEIPRNIASADFSFNEHIKIFTIKYGNLFLIKEKVSIGVHGGILFGETGAGDDHTTFGSFPIGLFVLHGNPMKNHFLEWGGELNVPREGELSLFNVNLGYRYRSKQKTALTLGAFYKLNIHPNNWYFHTANISLGIAFSFEE